VLRLNPLAIAPRFKTFRQVIYQMSHTATHIAKPLGTVKAFLYFTLLNIAANNYTNRQYNL